MASIFSQAFMRNAFIGGGAIAIALGLTGYFVVIRGEVFAGDAMSHVAFTGSLAALAFGVDQKFGLFASTVVIAVLLAVLNSKRFFSDIAIGTTFSWLLGLGALFLYLFTTKHATLDSNAGPNILFGSIFGIDESHAFIAVIVSAVVIVAMTILTRPLLFCSIDVTAARARGIPATLISGLFLILLAVQIAEAVQLIGSLLLLGLLTSPAAAAVRTTANPYNGLLLASVLCLGCVWIGLVISYLVPSLPASFLIIVLAFTCYVGATIRHRLMA